MEATLIPFASPGRLVFYHPLIFNSQKLWNAWAGNVGINQTDSITFGLESPGQLMVTVRFPKAAFAIGYYDLMFNPAHPFRSA
jgi:hypothetical protein